ncbi:LacI family DNA-binding transcriptional regulator [Rhodoferax sp.]|uniref:LacI family DNA-binding transcriptional regulator n=1 Tax=Rhodoferax sp. TaxID=50421 RepID=UPI00284D2861|nr:LacI family DNA-binding transcriptional regulator [Rhodoferax sp.]MDR3367544.1 LacI family DNA-binding transcriptional regulator [Rhodoferax sp.]
MSIKDVALQAGVSMSTVSRVFNLPDKVNAATRERVLQTTRAMGYLPNASARSLRTQRSRVLGVVLPTLLNPVFAECLDGIAQAARAAGYAILPITTDYELAQEEQAVQQLLAGNVDGLLLAVSNPATSSALARLQAANLPYVLVYNRHPEHPCVSVDGEQAVRDVVARLVAMGHRRITLISGQLAASDRAQQRQRGFCAGMAAHGLEGSPWLEVPFVETAVQEICGLLQRNPRPTALVCSNDLIAIRAIRAAHLVGLRVPQDISITGFDGIALGEDLTPMLSTVTQPNAAIGQCGVELLVQALAAGLPLTPSASVSLDHAFRVGESCAPVSLSE